MSYICKWGWCVSIYTKFVMIVAYIFAISRPRIDCNNKRGGRISLTLSNRLLARLFLFCPPPHCWYVLSLSVSLCVARFACWSPPPSFFLAAFRPEVVFVSCRIVEGSTEEPHTQRGDLSGHARHKSLLFPNDFHQTTWSCDQIEHRKTQRFVLKFFDS